MKHIATPPNDDRATTIGNMHKNSVKISRKVFEICERTNRQTTTDTRHNTSHYSRRRTNKMKMRFGVKIATVYAFNLTSIRPSLSSPGFSVNPLPSG